MPRVEVVVKTKDGQSILLTEGDRIEKTVTIECNSQRCASRHGQELPQEVSLIDGQPMPENGRQWLSLILPETSPQYTPMPPNFCGPTCVRDFLIYDYIAPSSAGVQKADCVPVENLTPEQQASLGLVQKTDLPDKYCVTEANGGCVSTDPRCMHNLPESIPHSAADGVLEAMSAVAQADGDSGLEGENPIRLRFL